MLTKEWYEQVKKELEMPSKWTAALHESMLIAVAEYERANPPTPQVVCPACGAEMIPLNTSEHAWWACTRDGCKLGGPYDDPDGSKVMALGRRKLPLDKDQLYLIYKSGGRMFAGHMKYLLDNKYERLDQCDPIDIAEWFQ